MDFDFASSTDGPVFNVNFMPLNHVGGRLPIGVVVPCRRHQLFRSRVRSFDVVRGLGACASDRHAAGAARGRHALPAVPQRRRPARRRRLGRSMTPKRPPRSSCGRRSSADGCIGGFVSDRTAGRGDEDVHRRGPRRAHHRRLRHDRGRRRSPRTECDAARSSSTTSSSTSPNSATSSPTSPIRAVNCWSRRRR